MTKIAERLLLTGAVPVLLVRDVRRAATFYQEKLCFRIDFLHGVPPFYGSVSRDGARMHLRFVHEPYFAELAQREESLIAAFIEVSNAKALFTEFESRAVAFAQGLVNQVWGGIDFQVRDPDGNRICFAEYRD
ncbi:MAG TPA: glyoxalase superfamily protein [Candidatus Cybelea sp.]|jgi:catechol 2,3-dioxygenase-like lactoylglutathione lyase family enzyme|nr:glyoxalase superfamily protein [Candidatus Cybelea sp.]